jgi:hypothetical protein
LLLLKPAPERDPRNEAILDLQCQVPGRHQNPNR